MTRPPSEAVDLTRLIPHLQAAMERPEAVTPEEFKVAYLMRARDDRQRALHENENPRRYLEQTAGVNQQGMERGQL